jgi:gliding motility-associated-like protein
MYTENSYGCWDADTVNVGILLELKIYIPTAFSPNGDGLNDCFSISGTTGDVVNNFRIRVFDRWGNLIFNDLIDSPDCIWDGRDQEGETLPVGTYLYRITGNDMRGGRQNFEGSVTIYK